MFSVTTEFIKKNVFMPIIMVEVDDMRINGVPNAPQPMDNNGKGKRSFKVEKYSGEVFIHTHNKSVDFKTFIRAVKDSMNVDDIRRKHVEELTQLVKSGRYSVDTEKLAQKMLEAMGARK